MKPYPDGFSHHPLYFTPTDQVELVACVADALGTAPFFQPRMPRTGTPTSVVMTNFGPLGWVSDRAGGYRYQATHPETGADWPALPGALRELWFATTDWREPPDCCLVNWYRPVSVTGRPAKMGAHVDNDEAAIGAPIVGVSLGDTATFRLGGLARGGPTRGVGLHSGDVVVMAGESRRRYHAVSRVEYGSSALLPQAVFAGGGRLNLTMRKVV